MTSGLTPYYKVLGRLQEGDYFGEHWLPQSLSTSSAMRHWPGPVGTVCHVTLHWAAARAGEYSCLLGECRTATVVALNHVELYSLSRESLEQVSSAAVCGGLERGTGVGGVPLSRSACVVQHASPDQRKRTQP
jgi:CRP-like cAMP-binding protein